MHYQIPVGLPGLPIHMYCISDASVAFVPNNPQMNTMLDISKDYYVVFDSLGFSINNEDFSYQEKYFYKENETLLGWLKSLELEMPQII